MSERKRWPNRWGQIGYVNPRPHRKQAPSLVLRANESLETVEFRARPKYGPNEILRAALFILDCGYPIDEATLQTYKILSSRIGPCVYLQDVDDHSMIRHTIAIPNRKIKRIGIQLWKAQTELILEDISFRSQGGTLTSVHACVVLP